MPQGQSSIKERHDTHEPQRFKVIIHNDDFTTMEFVIKILTEVFFMTEENAIAVTMQVHNEQKGVAGIYSYDVARSKTRKATRIARENGFPLRFSIEPEE